MVRMAVPVSLRRVTRPVHLPSRSAARTGNRALDGCRARRTPAGLWRRGVEHGSGDRSRLRACRASLREEGLHRCLARPLVSQLVVDGQPRRASGRLGGTGLLLHKAPGLSSTWPRTGAFVTSSTSSPTKAHLWAPTWEKPAPIEGSRLRRLAHSSSNALT